MTDLEELMQVEEIQEVLYLYNANTFYADTSLELALTSQSSTNSTPDSVADGITQMLLLFLLTTLLLTIQKSLQSVSEKGFL